MKSFVVVHLNFSNDTKSELQSHAEAELLKRKSYSVKYVEAKTQNSAMRKSYIEHMGTTSDGMLFAIREEDSLTPFQIIECHCRWGKFEFSQREFTKQEKARISIASKLKKL